MQALTSHQIRSRRFVILAVLCLSLLVVVVDGSIVNVAIPTLVRSLHASTASIQWVTDAYTLAMAGLLLPLGSLGDRLGRHRTLAGGLAVFGAGSALAGLAGSAEALIACRGIMGIGAAAIMPATLSILTNVFTDAAERARAIAAWSAVAGLGVAIGPTLGGWLLEHFAWGSIFLVNLPIVAVALAAGRLVVPASRSARPTKLDPAGAALSAAGVTAVVYAIIAAPARGWGSPATIGMATLGAVLLAVWAVVELRSTHPMIDLRIFANARFSAASFAMTMIFFALFGWLFLFTQQMQFVLGYNALQAGLRSLPFALTIGVLAQPAAKLATRFGTKLVVTAGLTVMAGGLALMATATARSGYPFLLTASVIIAAGMGLAMAPATESIMGALPRAQAGVGSAVNDTARNLGGALGVAILGSLASSAFAAQLHPVLAQAPTRHASQAPASIGAAVTAGQHIPGPIGHHLIEAARQAYVIGADHALIAAIAAAVAGAIVAARYLPARAVTAPVTAPATIETVVLDAATASTTRAA
jgi:EmrB/QacA subfamily drug resistance transporter